MEVISLITSQAAEHLGVSDSVGTIARGFAADLVVVKGDPASDVRALAEPELVFKDGIAYDPVKLREPLHGLVGWH